MCRTKSRRPPTTPPPNQTQLQTQIANLQDADLTGSILTLNQDQTQEQAALQSEARIPRTTLFDFLA